MTGKFRAAHGDLAKAVQLYNGRGPNARAYARIIMQNIDIIKREKLV